MNPLWGKRPGTRKKCRELLIGLYWVANIPIALFKGYGNFESIDY